jgi:hypothetical protein
MKRWKWKEKNSEKRWGFFGKFEEFEGFAISKTGGCKII